jgi:hypothetical protein
MKPAHDTNSGAPKNMPRDIEVHHDPAGTSPNRYANANQAPDADYSQTPDNHTAAEDRLISPETGD